MIALFAHDDYAALGIATALELERMPYRRVGGLQDAGALPVVAVGADFSREESLALAARRAVVLHGGPAFVRHALGAGDAVLAEGVVRLPLSEPIVPAALFAQAQPFGITALTLPRVPYARLAAAPPRGRAQGWLLAEPDDREAPAALALGDCLWLACDLGTAFAHLLTEDYAPAPRGGAPGWLRRAAESLYYWAPEALRAGA
ncbi:MAG: hypothetical protein SF182_10510, partial [Deltaproteobacteria bacterium]|nr:hypothetical protein [Deltaproteobacteria bacterium]